MFSATQRIARRNLSRSGGRRDDCLYEKRRFAWITLGSDGWLTSSFPIRGAIRCSSNVSLAAVEGRGKAVWLDTEGIEAGEVFPIALRRAIEGSDAFVFVITPDSVASQFCEQEIEHAQTLGKRILPVLRSRVPDEGLPAEVRERNWIPFEDDEQFAASVDRLIAALDKDLDHAQAHTRWLVKALDWEAHGRDKSFLLRGSELASGEAWLAGVKDGAEPEPTSLQREYVYASRTVSTRRQRLVVGLSLVAVVVALALAVFALISRSQARRSAAVAVRSATTAEAQRLGAQALTVTPPDESFLYARESYNLEPSSATRGYLFAAQARSPAALAVVTPVPERIQCDALEPRSTTATRRQQPRRRHRPRFGHALGRAEVRGGSRRCVLGGK